MDNIISSFSFYGDLIMGLEVEKTVRAKFVVLEREKPVKDLIKSTHKLYYNLWRVVLKRTRSSVVDNENGQALILLKLIHYLRGEMKIDEIAYS
jgi:hypothetical protein